MSRRKFEQPVPQRLQTYSATHPVALLIATGDHWFDAWLTQCATPIARLARQTGISAQRLLTIAMDHDRVSEAELDALARAWNVSTDALRASIGDPTQIVP